MASKAREFQKAVRAEKNYKSDQLDPGRAARSAARVRRHHDTWPGDDYSRTANRQGRDK